MLDAREGARQGSPRRVGGDVGGEYAAARVGVPEGDDFALTGVKAREHDRRLDGLGAAVREEGLAECSRSDGGESLGHLHLVLGHVEGRCVTQDAELLAHPVDHLGVAMADGCGEDPAEEIEELAAFRVEDPRAVALDENQGIVVQGRSARE